MISGLIETWHIHNRIHLYLLDAVPADALHSRTPASNRSIAGIFAHIHSVRLQWIEPNEADLMTTLSKIPARSQSQIEAITPDIIRQALTASGDAMALMLERRLKKGKVSGFKPHASAFFAYIIAHDSHHRGEIGIILSALGHRLPKEIDHGLWNWAER